MRKKKSEKKTNQEWKTENKNEFISSGNASLKTGNPLIDNVGL